MKTDTRRRLWWVLMYDDPKSWAVWKWIAWLLPAAVAAAVIWIKDLYQ